MKSAFVGGYRPDQPCASFYRDARTYREFSPSPALAEYVFCYWTSPPDGFSDSLFPVPPSVETIVPDSCIDIVFNITKTGVTSSVVGPFDSPLLIPVDLSHAKDFGVRFLLPDFFMFAGISPREFVNTSLNARDVFGDGWGLIEEMVCSAADDVERVRILDAALPRFAGLSKKHAGLMTRMFALIFSGGGKIHSREIALAAEVSPRQLRRICIEYTGFNPKTISRIIRFQNFIRTFRGAQEMSFTDAAYTAGFSDQAHMIREFRSFSGKTPSSIL